MAWKRNALELRSMENVQDLAFQFISGYGYVGSSGALRS